MEYTFRVKDYQLNIREILDNKQKCYKPNKLPLKPNLLPRMNEDNIRHDRHVKYWTDAKYEQSQTKRITNTPSRKKKIKYMYINKHNIAHAHTKHTQSLHDIKPEVFKKGRKKQEF